LLADLFVKGIRLDLVSAIVVGILGALLGGWLLGSLGIFAGSGFLGELLTAFVGAVVLLFLVRALRHR
jgi:uncharacterized membrane protein YeaQ/YmgE (transglycosylase-associated protein family)